MKEINKKSTFGKEQILGTQQISNDQEFLLNKNEKIERQRIFTDREASEYLRISQVTLWRLRKAGKISFRRAASKIIYMQEDLEDYLQSTKRVAFGCTN